MQNAPSHHRTGTDTKTLKRHKIKAVPAESWPKTAKKTRHLAMAGFLFHENRRCYGETGADVVDADEKVVGPACVPFWFATVIATPAITAAAPIPINRVPVPISSAGFTPAGLPGANAPSAAKAALPTIVATVTAATTLLKPNIGFPRLSDGGYLSEALSQVNRPLSIPF
jgi:hypothetical protein